MSLFEPNKRRHERAAARRWTAKYDLVAPATTLQYDIVPQWVKHVLLSTSSPSQKVGSTDTSILMQRKKVHVTNDCMLSPHG